MNRRRILIFTAVLAVAAGPVRAQATRDTGSTPFGSRGYEWQTEQQLAKEALAQLEAEFARKSQEEWLQEALAWVTFDCSQQGRIAVDESFRVAGVGAGKKAEVTVVDEDPMIWEIGYPKKPPKQLELKLTDRDGTEVTCDFGPSTREMTKGYLGVFVHEGRLLCLPRAASASEAS